jgi:nucleoprotein TPR
LEAQVLDWRRTGQLLEKTGPVPLPANGSISAVASPTTATSSTGPPTTKPAVAPSPTTPVTASAPRKPSPIIPTSGATVSDGVSRGRGRGFGRGRGMNIRGAAPSVPSEPTPSTSSVSILGAATKRSLDDAEVPDDSLAKRLKPAEVTTKPVTIRRDRVPPPS